MQARWEATVRSCYPAEPLTLKAVTMVTSMPICLTDTISLLDGFRQALDYNFIDNASDAWQATTTPFLQYNFRITKIVVPYLGIQGGIVWNDRDITGTFGPNAGVKLSLRTRPSSTSAIDTTGSSTLSKQRGIIVHMVSMSRTSGWALCGEAAATERGKQLV